MSDQRTIGYHLPITRAMFDDPQALGHAITRAMELAWIELVKASEGRRATIDRIGIDVAEDRAFAAVTPKDMFTLALHMTVTIAE